MNPTIPAQCLRCGVCCYSDSAAYVWIRGDDWARLGEDADRLAHFIGHRAFMRMKDGHCAALEVRATVDGAKEFFCTVYERRPEICRDLGRGSPECEAELELKSHVTAGAGSARKGPGGQSGP